jgi:hypothetical protein
VARELAANDWQGRDLISAEGGAVTVADRIVILVLDWRPRASTARADDRRTGITVRPD